MDIQINEYTKWNVQVPSKSATSASYTMTYSVYFLDQEGVWQFAYTQTSTIDFPSAQGSTFNSMSPYEKLIYVVKLLNPDFKTEEDKVKEFADASLIPAELKALLAKDIDAAVSKYKLLTSTEVGAIKTAVK